MSTKGQTHQKRAREVARRERRELKQAKKAQRAAAGIPTAEGANNAAADGEPSTTPGWVQ